MAMVHIAGPFIQVRVTTGEVRVVQRCCACGEVLIDTLGQMAPLKDRGVVLWPIMGLIEVAEVPGSGGRRARCIADPPDDPTKDPLTLPQNCCAFKL